MSKPRALLIAEKPSVARAIQSAYSKISGSYPYEITITSARGHLLELLEPDEYRADWGKPWNLNVLPMIPNEWKTKVIENAADVLKNIKDLYDTGHYDFIINAGDAGEEGSLIQALIYDYLNVNIPIYRLWADDVTEQTLIKALNNLRPNQDFIGYELAGRLRQHLDWLIGMNFSRAVSLNLDRYSAIGRVMTALLGMIVRREKEIKDFVPVPFYEINAVFRTASGDKYTGKLINPNAEPDATNKFAFFSKNEVNNLLSSIRAIRESLITNVSSEERKINAPALFSLADLQKDCALKFGYDAAKTLEITQTLYEAGYVSYPRTESKCMTKAQICDIPTILQHIGRNKELDVASFVSNIFSDNNTIANTVKSKKYVDDSKVSDHPAITPTVKPCDVTTLDDMQKNVYETICKRFVAIFLPAQIKIAKIIENTLPYITEKFPSGLIFRASSISVKQLGWKELYRNETFEDDEDDGVTLPLVYPGETTTNEHSDIYVGETSPKKRYNDATIIAAMETAGRTITSDEELAQILKDCAGLGTAATRGEILKKLESNGYVERKGNKTKQFIPTKIGMDLIEALGDRSITSAILTAEWQKKLTQVKRGELSYDDFEKDMIAYVSKEVAGFNTLPKLGTYTEIIGKCPACKSRNVVISQRSNKFAYCEGYANKDSDGNRDCSFFIPLDIYGTALTKKDMTNLLEKGKTNAKPIKNKDGKKKLHSISLGIKKDGKLGIVLGRPDALGMCPVCKKGEVYESVKSYYCENYKGDSPESTCNFVFSKKYDKTIIGSGIVKEILETGRTKKPVKVNFSSGKSYTAPLRIVFSQEYGYSFDFLPFEPEKICKCPNCIDGQIITDQYYYVCSNYPVGNCRMKFAKEALSAKITAADAKKLLNKDTIHKKVTFKNGESAEKDLYLIFDVEADRYFIRYKQAASQKSYNGKYNQPKSK